MIVTPAQILAAAFHDDPMFVFIEPVGDRRRRVLPWFFGSGSRVRGERYWHLFILGVAPGH